MSRRLQRKPAKLRSLQATKPSKYGKVSAKGRTCICVQAILSMVNLSLAAVLNFFFRTCSCVANVKSWKSKFHSECLQIRLQHREFPSKMRPALLSSKSQSVVNRLELITGVSSTVLFWLNHANASTQLLATFVLFATSKNRPGKYPVFTCLHSLLIHQLLIFESRPKSAQPYMH